MSHAVLVPEPLTAGDRPDYADAYRIRLAQPDPRSAEQWIRDALERSTAVRWIVLVVHRHVLRFRLGPLDDDHVIGWSILTSVHDEVRLQATSSLFRGEIHGRRDDPRTATITTSLHYGRPVLSRLIWACVGPLHRRIAPFLLGRAARLSV